MACVHLTSFSRAERSVAGFLPTLKSMPSMLIRPFGDNETRLALAPPYGCVHQTLPSCGMALETGLSIIPPTLWEGAPMSSFCKKSVLFGTLLGIAAAAPFAT